jgi:hypothetical protein
MLVRLVVPAPVAVALVRIARALLRLSRRDDAWSRALRIAVGEARADVLAAYRSGEKDEALVASDLRAVAAWCETELAATGEASRFAA